VIVFSLNYFEFRSKSFLIHLCTHPTFQAPSLQPKPHPLLQNKRSLKTRYSNATNNYGRQDIAGLRTYSLGKCILYGILQVAALGRLRPPAQRRHPHPALHGVTPCSSARSREVHLHELRGAEGAIAAAMRLHAPARQGAAISAARSFLTDASAVLPSKRFAA
jgi:hypothetical protein